ncbi:hypothetical protein [Paraburkholderia sp. MM5482-R1]|uniref:hypothetical protein n=1 Tax=unclassified Paraburkholderia TaxID=2615204 RepID=UPI003D192783
MTTLSEPRNRLVQVIESTEWNGIDFVELMAVDATTLYVHFLNAVPVATAGIAVTIVGGDRIQGITVHPVDNATGWSVDADGRPILAVKVSEAGDFSTYTLTITGAPLDPSYQSTTFSFKVLCPADFDCAASAPCCTGPEPPLPAIDYTAKDFQSFRQALSDFSAQLYPAWQERSEADFGVMFMEALCALADELSYLQDRVAAEATLLGATQRRSLVSMARLVDYEPRPLLSAVTTVQCNVVGTTVPPGALISATRPDGVVVPFEIGTGLADTAAYPVSQKWNFGQLQPYWFDDSQRCLACGSTGMWLQGHGLGFVSPSPGQLGTALLIQTDLPGESIREVVHVISSTEAVDAIFPTPGSNTPVTRITWAASEALNRDHDLTRTQIGGNLLPATQGQRFGEAFVVGTAPAAAVTLPVAIARRGPNATDVQPNWIIRYPLSNAQPASMSALASLATLSTGANPRLTWLMPGSGEAAGTVVDPDIVTALPELAVSRRLPEPQPFTFATSLLDASATETSYTVDPAAWRVVAANAQGVACQWEYDGDVGDTLRFGDGTFGAAPNDGDVFDVQYRLGLGAAGNVVADAVCSVDVSARVYLSGVRNPFDVTNGADAETVQRIQRMAPQAFRAVQYRAVRPEDYQAAAQTLPWVLKAGTSFRWTGSWLTVFTTVDPKANGTSGSSATLTEEIELIELLNRRRLAGYESYAPPPTLVSIDLVITICVQMGWLGSDVERAVLSRLADASQTGGSAGFFYADSFTFGTPLYRSSLEAAIQGVAGVSGVLTVEYRRRGATEVFQPLPDVFEVGPDEILRVENNPDFPEHGTIRVNAMGER